MKTLLVVDGNSIVNRAFYGVHGLTTKSGFPTNALFGTVNILQKHLDRLHPDYAAIAFDVHAPTFRHLRYEGYKATRKGMPEELYVQMPYVKKIAEAMGFKALEHEGFEADDILGTVSLAAAQTGDICAYVLTGDRDSLQLIGDGVKVILARNKEDEVYDEKAFFDAYGFPVCNFVSLKALMGDSSDNIPGVPGIGEKTATALIRKFGHLDDVYRNYESDDTLSPSVKRKLADGIDSAKLSYELATIERHAPIGVTIEELKNPGIDRDELAKLFSALEFGGLLRKYGLTEVAVPHAGVEETAAENATEKADENGQYLIGEEPPVTEKKTVETVGIDAENVKQIKENRVFVLYENNVLSVYDGKRNYRIETGDNQTVSEVLSSHECIVHDAKKFYRIGLETGRRPNIASDVKLNAYVLDPNVGKYDALSLFGEDAAAYDVAVLYEEQVKNLAETGMASLVSEIELPLSEVLAEMETTGCRLDLDGLSAYGTLLSNTAALLQREIYDLAGEEFNINSPKQLGEILFEKLGLPHGKKTKSGYSTSADILAKLSPVSPIVSSILDYRQVTKLIGTYCEGLGRSADADGVVHTSFHQTVTATGRLSSSDPNLQNIPVRTELGREFRKYFVPRPGYVFVDADYSQIELRLLAHLSADEAMVEAFCSGRDIHTSTASEVFHVAPEDVTPEMRKRAKAVNFGIVYGIGAYSLSDDLHIPVADAKEYIEGYFATYPRIDAYLQKTVADARKNGYTATMFGRRRYLPELAAKNKMVQAFGERAAMNSPIQGTAADVIKIAMLRVSRALKAAGIDARLILQVHDELIVEAAEGCAEEAARILKTEMENAASLLVPLTADTAIGANWYEAH